MYAFHQTLESQNLVISTESYICIKQWQELNDPASLSLKKFSYPMVYNRIPYPKKDTES